MTMYDVVLHGGGPWGFRISGGRDVNQPISISRVTPGSKASSHDIASGDVITAIDGCSTSDMTHLDAQNMVKSAGMAGTLRLTLHRDHHAAGYGPTQQHGGPTVAHLQYNTPVNLYSTGNIVEAFKGQTRGLNTEVQLLDNMGNQDAQYANSYGPPATNKLDDISLSPTYQALKAEERGESYSGPSGWGGTVARPDSPPDRLFIFASKVTVEPDFAVPASVGSERLLGDPIRPTTKVTFDCPDAETSVTDLPSAALESELEECVASPINCTPQSASSPQQYHDFHSEESPQCYQISENNLLKTDVKLISEPESRLKQPPNFLPVSSCFEHTRVTEVPPTSDRDEPQTYTSAVTFQSTFESPSPTEDLDQESRQELRVASAIHFPPVYASSPIFPIDSNISCFPPRISEYDSTKSTLLTHSFPPQSLSPIPLKQSPISELPPSPAPSQKSANKVVKICLPIKDCTPHGVSEPFEP